jgi:hypothetical protein
MNEKDRLLEQLKQFEMFVKSRIENEGFPIVQDDKSGDPIWIDMREVTLRYLISVKGIDRFFRGLRGGKVMATYCKVCDITYFPPQKDCPSCLTDNVEWKEIENEGFLLTFTVVFVRPYSFMHHSPYTVGIARFGDITITAWVRGDPKSLRPGQKVKLEVVKREPEGYLTYELVPV